MAERGTCGWKTAIAGAGFLADAYDLFVIDTVNNILKLLYGQTAAEKAAVANAALIGSILGQLAFGVLADLLGRKRCFVITAVLITGGALLSATATAGHSVGLYAQLCIWRGLLGFGVGGEYPLSATITSEGSSQRNRGRAMASVFAMQGFGKLLAALVDWAVIAGSSEFVPGGVPLDWAWRLALAFGAVPAALTVYARTRMHESAHFKASAAEERRELELPAGAAGGSVASALVGAAKPGAAAAASVGALSFAAGVDGTPMLGRSSGARAATGSEADAALELDGTPLDCVSTASSVPVSGATGADALSMAHVVAPPAPVSPGSGSPQAEAGLLTPRGAESALRSRGALMWHWGRTLFGAAGCWFLLDVTFYGQGLMSTSVVQTAIVGADSSASPADKLRAGALGSLAVVAMALPGYLCAIVLVDRVGRRRLQLAGFAACAATFAVLGFAYTPLTQLPALFVVLYGLTYAFSNAGPNTTTFIVPAEAFPTRIRATAHGISAASGKLGATIGSITLTLLANAYCAGGTCASPTAAGAAEGARQVMLVCAAVCVVGLGVTYVATSETRDVRLEDLDAEARRVLAEAAARAAREDAAGRAPTASTALLAAAKPKRRAGDAAAPSVRAGLVAAAQAEGSARRASLWLEPLPMSAPAGAADVAPGAGGADSEVAAADISALPGSTTAGWDVHAYDWEAAAVRIGVARPPAAR